MFISNFNILNNIILTQVLDPITSKKSPMKGNPHSSNSPQSFNQSNNPEFQKVQEKTKSNSYLDQSPPVQNLQSSNDSSGKNNNGSKISEKYVQSVYKALFNMELEDNDEILDKATESHHSLKDRKDFTYDEGTGLYSIDYASEKIMPLIGQAYINRLKTTNLYLMNKIEIGPFIKYDKLQLLFSVHFESLQHLVLERNWKEGQQHGFDFFKNTENLKNIRRLTLKGNYFSPKFMEEKSIFNLPKLEFLELNFEEEMKNQEIYDLIEKIAKFKDTFIIRLWTSKSKKQFDENIQGLWSMFQLIPKKKGIKSRKLMKQQGSKQQQVQKRLEQKKPEESLSNGINISDIKDINKQGYVGQNLVIGTQNITKNLFMNYNNGNGTTNQRDNQFDQNDSDEQDQQEQQQERLKQQEEQHNNQHSQTNQQSKDDNFSDHDEVQESPSHEQYNQDRSPSHYNHQYQHHDFGDLDSDDQF